MLTAVVTSKSEAPKSGRGRGRPRKSIDPNGTNTTTEKTEKTPEEKSESADAKAEDEEAEEDDDSGRSYWLMKAEPESRIEKGVDVKFSIDDLRERTKPEPWDGKNLTSTL